MSKDMFGNIFIGFYIAVGDLVCAHRALSIFAERNAACQIYIGIGKGAEGVKDIFSWPPNVIFVRFVLPRVSNLADSITFIREFCKRRYIRVINSPHAPAQRVSWKIPLFMRLMAMLRYANRTEGPSGDPFSFLYHKSWPISREIPLPIRDEVFFDLIRTGGEGSELEVTPYFSRSAFAYFAPPRSAIGIHVGASLENKRWPVEHVVSLCWLIRRHFNDIEIDILGLEHELSEIKTKKLPEKTSIVICSFAEAVARLTSLRAIVTMDSGFMHIAAVAQLPQVAIFGSSSIKPHFPNNPRAIASNRQVLSCQPCDLRKCLFEKNYCMYLVSPEQVLQDLMNVLASAESKSPQQD